MISKKEIYESFCNKIYVPIYSKSWWMDAICGEENWDIWFYKKGNEVIAAMPYYTEIRRGYTYITKAPLTQNNGVLFCYPENQTPVKKAKLEEEIIREAIAFLKAAKIDVYEQQFHYNFRNYLPYFWEEFDVIPRLTYVIDKSTTEEELQKLYTSNYRNTIRKGRKSIAHFSTLTPEEFYREHKKIYCRQGIECPFSYELWMRLYKVCSDNQSGEIVTSVDMEGNILSLAYVVWDEKSSYLLMGGAIPEYSSLQTYSVLVDECIRRSLNRGLCFDFEGSVIKRINHSFREYGGTPMLYYRIRKVFNPEIIMEEARNKAEKLRNGNDNIRQGEIKD